MTTTETAGSDRAVRVVTVLAVLLVAGVAAVVSYVHMSDLAREAGEDWRSLLLPLSVDGLVVAASMVLLTRRRAELPGGWLAWVALLGGMGTSLAANVAAAEPTTTARIVAGWPALAFAVAFELLLQQRRASVSEPVIEVPAPRQVAGDDAGEVRQVDHQVHQSAGVEFGEPPAYGIHLVHPQVVDEAPDQATPGAGGDDQPPGDDVVERARRVIDDGTKRGVVVGRARLARELGISEHQARQLLATHLASDASDPGDPGDDLASDGTEATR